jgi:hypothetical protein
MNTTIPFDIAAYTETLKKRIETLRNSKDYIGGSPAVFNGTRATVKALEEIVKDMKGFQSKNDEAHGIIRPIAKLPKTFTYKGHTFTGVRAFTDVENERSMKDIMWCCRTQKLVFPLDDDRVQRVYNHTGFYRAAAKAGYAKFDLFKCKGMILMPANNELFQYDDIS